MYPWTRIGSVALLLAVAVACSENDLSNDRDDNDTSAQDPEDTADTAPSDGDDEAEPAVPEWIRVDGTIVIAAGVPDPLLSSVSIEYRADPGAGEAADTGLDGTALPCVQTPAITSFTSATAPEAEITLGWWAVALDATVDSTCPYALPHGLHLGIGDLDTQLYAAMDLDGLATTDSTLYGLYARIGADGAPVWVYGVVGTVDQYAGASAPVTAPPLPDGTYDLRALHLLPFTP